MRRARACSTGCTLQSLGFETELTINGYDYFAEDRALKFFVIGGVKNGSNDLSLTIKPAADVPADAEHLIQVDLLPSLTRQARKACASSIMRTAIPSSPAP